MAEDRKSISSVHVIFWEYLGILVTRHLYINIFIEMNSLPIMVLQFPLRRRGDLAPLSW